MTETGARAPSILQVLRRNRDVRRMWLAQLTSESGTWITRIAVVTWVANDPGESALAVAAILALQILPLFVASPLAGVLADRLPRRSVMLGADLCAAVLVLGYLPILALPRSTLSLSLLGLLVFAHVTMGAVFEASRSSLLAAAAEPEELAAANMLGQITWSTCLAAGSALGGAVLALFGREAAVLLDSASFLGSAVILLGVRAGRRAAAASEDASHARHQGFAGVLRWMKDRPGTALFLLPKLFLGFVGINDLTFALLGPREYGLASEDSFFPYYVAVGLGTFVGAPIAMRIAGSHPRAMRTAIAVAFLLEALVFAGTLVTDSLLLRVVFAGSATAGGSVVWAFSTTLLQRAMPDRLTGRAVALDLGLATGAMAVSLLVAGALVDAIDLRPFSMLVIGAAVYASGGILWLAVVVLRAERPWDGDAGRPA